MKRVLLLLSLIALLATNESYAQTTMTSARAQDRKEMVTALEPADKTPYVFASEEDKRAAVAKKIDALKEEVLNGQLSAEQVKERREQIWRLENAVVRNN